MKINDIITENLRTENPCWKGYKAVGTKKKGGRTVPNCVPKEGVAEGSLEESSKGDWFFAKVEELAQMLPKDKFVARAKQFEMTPKGAAKFWDSVNYKGGGEADEFEKYFDLYQASGAIYFDPWLKAYKKRNGILEDQGVTEGSLNEFAIGGGDDGGEDDEYDMSHDAYTAGKAQALNAPERFRPEDVLDYPRCQPFAGKYRPHFERGWAEGRKLLSQRKGGKSLFTIDGREIDIREGMAEGQFNLEEELQKLDDAKYHGRTVPLNKPMQGDVKKSKVYVKDPSSGNVKKVNFGDPNMRIKKSSPGHRKSFRARHHCENPGPKTKARYWSCRAW